MYHIVEERLHKVAWKTYVYVFKRFLVHRRVNMKIAMSAILFLFVMMEAVYISNSLSPVQGGINVANHFSCDRCKERKK